MVGGLGFYSFSKNALLFAIGVLEVRGINWQLLVTFDSIHESLATNGWNGY